MKPGGLRVSLRHKIESDVTHKITGAFAECDILLLKCHAIIHLGAFAMRFDGQLTRNAGNFAALFPDLTIDGFPVLEF
jgi:hypothetical protein